MHRQFSLKPYHRHYTHNPTHDFLDYLVPKEDGSVSGKYIYKDKYTQLLYTKKEKRKRNDRRLINSIYK